VLLLPILFSYIALTPSHFSNYGSPPLQGGNVARAHDHRGRFHPYLPALLLPARIAPNAQSCPSETRRAPSGKVQPFGQPRSWVPSANQTTMSWQTHSVSHVSGSRLSIQPWGTQASCSSSWDAAVPSSLWRDTSGSLSSWWGNPSIASSSLNNWGPLYRPSKREQPPGRDDMPEPEPCSGQRRGETREEFFACCNQEYEELKSRKSPTQQALQEAREEQYKIRPLPTASGPMVFEWQEEFGEHQSYWMRKRVPKSNWAIECQAAVRADGVNGVQYNPVKHEYDIAWQWKKVGEFVATDGLLNNDLDYNDRYFVEETPTSTIFISHAPQSAGGSPAQTSS
jgi:hypothetical protein